MLLPKLSSDRLRNTAIIYASLPLLVFFIGFLRWYYALISTAALIVVLFFVLKPGKFNVQFTEQTFSRRTMLVLFAVSLVWSYLGGMNGMWFQSSDWSCRNAIYFDLIQFGWPVIYERNGGALVYYIGIWLPPAAVAKAVVLISGSLEAGLIAGRILLWIWVSLGLTIVVLLMFGVYDVFGKKQRIAVTLLLVFFSGMDLLGAVLNYNLDFLLQPKLTHPSGPHLEWWMNIYQFSSNTTLLFWVFNQTIISWVISLLFLIDYSPKNYVFYAIACLLSGPFPCVGLAVLMIVKAAMYCLEKKRELHTAVKMILSPQNVLSLFFLFLPVASYLLAANAVSGETASVGRKEGISFFSSDYLNSNLYLFILLEVGLYLLLILVDHYKNPIYYALWGTFIIFPLFQVGTSVDFCMRATIPALFILMVYVGRFLQEHFTLRKTKESNGNRTLIQKVCSRILVVCLIIGVATPIVEFYRGFYHVLDQKTVFLEDDSLMTFNIVGTNYNFVTPDPENHFFFKHLAK